MKYTREQIYTAIHMAADKIESDPGCYEFCSYVVGDENCPACMFGHIGRFLKMDASLGNVAVARAIGIEETSILYRMDNYNHLEAAWAAKKLRRFAERHFAPDNSKPEPAPMSFSEIMTSLKSGTLEPQEIV